MQNYDKRVLYYKLTGYITSNHIGISTTMYNIMKYTHNSIQPVSYTHLDVYKRQVHSENPLP